MVYSYLSGRKLFNFRQALGLTQADMALLLGIHPGHLSRIERQESAQIRLSTIKQITEVIQPLTTIAREQGIEAARRAAWEMLSEKLDTKFKRSAKQGSAPQAMRATGVSNDIETPDAEEETEESFDVVGNSEEMHPAGEENVEAFGFASKPIEDEFTDIIQEASIPDMDSGLPDAEDIIIPIQTLIRQIEQLYYLMPDYLRHHYYRALNALVGAFNDVLKTRHE